MMKIRLNDRFEIEREEFTSRQDRVRERARELGLDGVVVYSRGGGPVDMHAEVYYLCNHYSPHPYFPDHSDLGTARAHAAAIIPTDGPVTLVVDGDWWRDDLVVADEIVVAKDLSRRVAEVVERTGMRRAGLVGTSFMSGSAYRGLMMHLGQTSISVEVHDFLVEQLRIYKSATELAILRHAADIGSRAVEAMMEAVVPGAREADAARAAGEIILDEGGVIYDTPATSGRLSHHFAWSRLPTYDPDRRMAEGEWFHADCYGAYLGYLWDFGRTRVVGKSPSAGKLEMLEASIGLVDHLAGAIAPGVTAGDVARSGQQWLRDNAEAFVDDVGETFPYLGHGVGLSWEAPWLHEKEDTILEPGMYLALEGLLGNEGLGGVFHEENGVVTEDGFEVWSTARKRWW